MSKELRRIAISCTVHSWEHLPAKEDGEQMYADDVISELSDVVQAAVTAWYEQRGNQLLACEPDVG